MSRLLRNRVAGPTSGGKLPFASGSTLNNGLIGYWDLQESAGSRITRIGSLDLTATGAVGSVAGKNGNAASFTDVTTYLASNPLVWSLPNASPNNGLTFACWMRRSANPSANSYTMSQGESSNPAWTMGINTAGRGIPFIRDNGNVVIAVAGVGVSLCDNNWHLCIMSWNENHDRRLHWYVPDLGIDQISAATSAFETLFSTAANSSLHVGIGPGTSGPWGGGGATALVDEVMIWDGARTLAERVELINSGAGKFFPF